MGAIASADDYGAAVAGRTQLWEYWRDSNFTVASGQYTSHWTGAGHPGQGAIPGAAANPTSATAGALAPWADPGGGEVAQLHSWDACYGLSPLSSQSTVAETDLWDRLAHVGGFDGTSTSINSFSLTISRGDTNGADAVAFVEIYTDLGATPQTLTVIYTNSAGTGSRSTTVAIPANARAGRLFVVPLLTGDFGVKSVQSAQLGGSTGTAGNYGITIGRRIASLDTKNTGECKLRSAIDLGICRVEAGTCFWLVTTSSSTSVGRVGGGLSIFTTGTIPTNESTTIAGMATIAATRQETWQINKPTNFTTVLGNFVSLWAVAGNPAAGATPGAAAAPTSATTGALMPFADPAASNFAHLLAIELAAQTGFGPHYLYDRLVHAGGLVGNVTTLQSLAAQAITRGDTTGKDVVGFLEIYTQLGGTPTTATVTYTNSAGTGGRTSSVAITATARAGRLFPIGLQDGDLGIKSVESVQFAASTGTAGNFGVTLARRISAIPMRQATDVASRVGLDGGYPLITAGSCLWLVAMASSANQPGPVVGGATIVTTA